MQRQILAAADEIIREGGSAALTMEGVALRAGVSKQSVYRRWSSRGDLLIDLYFGSDFEPQAAIAGTTFRERFTSYLDWSVKRLFDPSRASILRALAVEGQTDVAVREALTTRIVEPRLAQGRSLIQEGKSGGEVRQDLDVDTALEFVFGSVWFNVLIKGGAIDSTWEMRTLDTFFRLADVSGDRS